MNLNEKMSLLDSVFIHDFPSVNHEYLENGFREVLRKTLFDRSMPSYVFDVNGKPDLDWISFLWWIFRKDTVRINDALHGYIWTPEGEGKLLNDEDSRSRLIMNDPISRAEHIKVKDYIKHINWIYHKTQDLPNITFIGGGNIPERLYGLRQSKITLIDPEAVLPKEILFPDYIQRRNLSIMNSDEVFKTSNSKNSLIGTQNVVIIDKRDSVFTANELEGTIIKAGRLLTHHGRCLFDIPMYGSAISESALFEAIGPFTEPAIKFIASNATAMDGYIHEIVSTVNQSDVFKTDDSFFEIEDLKLTDVGLSRSVAMRVYLKKSRKN